MDTTTFSQSEMVLVSMYRLAEGETIRLPYEEIVLQAWRDFPSVFSLRSHPEYPDASDIHKKIYQTLKPAGLVASLGNKVFRLTDSGVEQAAKLIGQNEPETTSPTDFAVRMSRSEETFYSHAANSLVFSLWAKGDRAKLIDHDARQFFQFSTGTAIEDRKLKSEFSVNTFKKGVQIGLKDASQLLELANYLSKQFADLFEKRKP